MIDTGGFRPVAKDGILKEMARQTLQALDEADIVIFLVDGRAGVTPQDSRIAELLRRRGRAVYLAVNKTEGMHDARVTLPNFTSWVSGMPYAISAAHGDRVKCPDRDGAGREGTTADRRFCRPDSEDADVATQRGRRSGARRGRRRARSSPRTAAAVKIAIVGHLNVGKSTLVNALIGEERVIAFDQPGTTRDSIYLDFSTKPRLHADRYRGRTQTRQSDRVHRKFSVIKTLQAIGDANVVESSSSMPPGVSVHDVQLASFVQDAGRALVVCLNKWDIADADARKTQGRLRAQAVLRRLRRDADHLGPKTRQGLDKVMAAAKAYTSAFKKLSTPRLTARPAGRHRQAAAAARAPSGQRCVTPIRGQQSARVVIHGTSLNRISDTYKRLERFFLDAFELGGTPCDLNCVRGIIRTQRPRSRVVAVAERYFGASSRGSPTRLRLETLSRLRLPICRIVVRSCRVVCTLGSIKIIWRTRSEHKWAIPTRPFLNTLRKGTSRSPSTRERHQTAGSGRIFRPVRCAAEEHRHPNGLQTYVSRSFRPRCQHSRTETTHLSNPRCGAFSLARRHAPMMFERHAGNDRAVLVQLAFGKAPIADDLEELQSLAATAGADTAGVITGRRENRTPHLFAGRGRLKIGAACAERHAELVIFNHPALWRAGRNPSAQLSCRVIDAAH